MRPREGNTSDAWESGQRVNETPEDSGAGPSIPADGIHIAGLPDGHRLDARGLAADPQERAVGVDGQTAAEYERDLEANLLSLLDRAKSGTYRAPPVRRVHIPKGGSTTETRPIGIPTLEDKILQRAVAMLLEPIYEQDFHDCSHGFRPGRSAHRALDALWKQTMLSRGGWVVEVEIRKFFDTLDHRHLRELVGKRVRDGVLLRLIGKWLKAGVMEEGVVSYPDSGTPQGGVISPMLSNIYLHYVLDEWFEREVKPRLKGRAHLIRYADDFVIGFTDEQDARRVMEVLPRRFGRYGLSLHPDKTRLVPFRQPPPGGGGGQRRSGTGQLRLPRLHPHLGVVPAGTLDSQAADGGKPPAPRGPEHRAVVPSQPTPAGSGAARGIESEGTRSLHVLRDHRQLDVVVAVPHCGRELLAQVA